jgi:hypothetical protein
VMNNTPGVAKKKKKIIVVLVVDGCRPTFFDGGVPVDRHSAFCLLV